MRHHSTGNDSMDARVKETAAKAVKAAIEHAIKRVGVNGLKQTSMFLSNEKQALAKAA